jgi:hypothetical protein
MSSLPSGTPVITIGAMKCGTSSLHRHLALHPQVSMSRVKELDFFIDRRNWSRGLAWYARQFDREAPVWGESSPNYTKHPTFGGVAKRMHGLVPNARLLFIARDPIARTLSHYRHNLAHGRERRTVEEALRDPAHNDYVYPSRYAWQIDEYLRWFDRSQLLLLDLDELSADPGRVLRRVFEHIGVDASFEHPSFRTVHHATERKLQPNAVGRALGRLPQGWWLRERAGRLAGTPLPSVTLPPEVRGALLDVLRPDAEAYRTLSGLPLAGWPTLAAS